MKHPDLDGRVIEVPDSAVPIYRQSNWELLTDAEVLAREKQRLEDRAARVQPSPAAPSQPAAPPKASQPAASPKADEPPKPEPAPRKSGSKPKEIS